MTFRVGANSGWERLEERLHHANYESKYCFNFCLLTAQLRRKDNRFRQLQVRWWNNRKKIFEIFSFRALWRWVSLEEREKARRKAELESEENIPERKNFINKQNNEQKLKKYFPFHWCCLITSVCSAPGNSGRAKRVLDSNQVISQAMFFWFNKHE